MWRLFDEQEQTRRLTLLCRLFIRERLWFKLHNRKIDLCVSKTVVVVCEGIQGNIGNNLNHQTVINSSLSRNSKVCIVYQAFLLNHLQCKSCDGIIQHVVALSNSGI